ncbi:MAG: RNA-dependent DNA polymerase, partial [Candidatus Moraniibacteriota bacterium]
MKTYKQLFEAIIDLENLFSAWDRFKQGKRSKRDVQKFERYLEQNIFELQRELQQKTYKHEAYTSFFIQDPKQRHIHKASVRDRVVHHAVFRIINPIFEPTFISYSFSCRVDKGTHKGVAAMEKMIRQVSRNYSRKCFVLECDIRSFFESIDHDVLLTILRKKVRDEDVLWLLEDIIRSHYSKRLSVFSLK